MSTTTVERLNELVRLLRDVRGDPDPDSKVHNSPLFPEEKSMTRTVAVLAACFPSFNRQGLGFDIPGTGDWPNVILVGIGGRRIGEEAIKDFFGLSNGLARRIVDELPSPGLLNDLSRYLAGQNPDHKGLMAA
jgi:hypothetical protein